MNDDHDTVLKHAAAIQQLQAAERDVKKAEGDLANLRATLEQRRKALAKFEGGADDAPPLPAASVEPAPASPELLS